MREGGRREGVTQKKWHYEERARNWGDVRTSFLGHPWPEKTLALTFSSSITVRTISNEFERGLTHPMGLASAKDDVLIRNPPPRKLLPDGLPSTEDPDNLLP